MTTFAVYLGSAPTHSVTVSIEAAPPEEVQVSPELLVFSQSTWNVPQYVEVKGLDDFKADGDAPFSLKVAVFETDDANFKRATPLSITGVNRDNEKAALIVEPSTQLVVSETGTSTTLTVSLATAPVDNVIVDLSSSKAGAAVVAPQKIGFHRSGLGSEDGEGHWCQ